jgi:hypothetical protein
MFRLFYSGEKEEPLFGRLLPKLLVSRKFSQALVDAKHPQKFPEYHPWMQFDFGPRAGAIQPGELASAYQGLDLTGDSAGSLKMDEMRFYIQGSDHLQGGETFSVEFVSNDGDSVRSVEWTPPANWPQLHLHSCWPTRQASYTETRTDCRPCYKAHRPKLGL